MLTPDVFAKVANRLPAERLHIDERIAAARLRVEAQGGRWGRPRRLNDTQIAKLVQLRRAGRTLRQIAIAVKCPASTIGDTHARVANR